MNISVFTANIWFEAFFRKILVTLLAFVSLLFVLTGVHVLDQRFNIIPQADAADSFATITTTSPTIVSAGDAVLFSGVGTSTYPAQPNNLYVFPRANGGVFDRPYVFCGLANGRCPWEAYWVAPSIPGQYYVWADAAGAGEECTGLGACGPNSYILMTVQATPQPTPTPASAPSATLLLSAPLVTYPTPVGFRWNTTNIPAGSTCTNNFNTFAIVTPNIEGSDTRPAIAVGVHQFFIACSNNGTEIARATATLTVNPSPALTDFSVSVPSPSCVNNLPRMTLNWGVSNNANKYIVYRYRYEKPGSPESSGVVYPVATVSTNSYTDNGLEAGDYQYQTIYGVLAVNDNTGETKWSTGPFQGVFTNLIKPSNCNPPSATLLLSAPLVTYPTPVGLRWSTSNIPAGATCSNNFNTFAAVIPNAEGSDTRPAIAVGVHQFFIACSNGGIEIARATATLTVNPSPSPSVTPPPSTPTATITVTPASGGPGNYTINWTTSNIPSGATCTNNWNAFLEDRDGSGRITPNRSGTDIRSLNATTTFTISCTNGTTASATATVIAPPAPFTVGAVNTDMASVSTQDGPTSQFQSCVGDKPQMLVMFNLVDDNDSDPNTLPPTSAERWDIYRYIYGKDTTNVHYKIGELNSYSYYIDKTLEPGDSQYQVSYWVFAFNSAGEQTLSTGPNQGGSALMNPRSCGVRVADGYRVAEDPNTLANTQYGNNPPLNQGTLTLDHTFTDANPGIKTLFVQFHYNDNSESQVLSAQITIEPQGSSSPTPTTDAPSITVTNPNGGNTWAVGIERPITWNYTPRSGTPNNVPTRIQLMRAEGNVRTNIGPVYNTISNSGENTFNWNIPQDTPVANNYRILIEAVPPTSSLGNNVTINDESDNNFSIGESSFVSCSPATQTVAVNQPAQFTASVAFSMDPNDTNWSAPGGNPATGTGPNFSTTFSTTGNHTITATNLSFTNTCTVITQTAGAPTVTVTSPNGGNTWAVGIERPITWNYTPGSGGTPNNVPTSIQLKRVDGNARFGVGPVYTTVSNSGENTFNWNIPQDTPVGDRYRIVVDAVPPVSSLGTNIPVTDESDNNFSIGEAAFVSCAPTSPTIAANQPAQFTASVAFSMDPNTTTWSAPGGNPATGTGPNFSTTYSSGGSKTVTVTNLTFTSNCTVTVTQKTPLAYRVAEDPNTLASATYLEDPSLQSQGFVNINHTFADASPGTKTIFTQFKYTDGTESEPFSRQIQLIQDAVIQHVNCAIGSGGTGVEFIIGGVNFGATAGSVKSGNTNLTINSWANDKVLAQLPNPSPAPASGQSYQIILTRADGAVSSAISCTIGTQQISLGHAKLFCRTDFKFDQDNVELYVLENIPGATAARQVVKIDQAGIIQGVTSPFKVGTQYKVGIRAPKGLRRNFTFTAAVGTNVLDNNEVILPIGDVYPQDQGDGIINALDAQTLRQNWGNAKSDAKKPYDFNRDGVVNSFEWACMRYDYGDTKKGDPIPTPSVTITISPSPTVSPTPSPSITPSATPTPSPAATSTPEPTATPTVTPSPTP